MRFFTLVVSLDGARPAPLAPRCEHVTTVADDHVAVALGASAAGFTPTVVREPPWLAVGDVRLDDRDALWRSLGHSRRSVPDETSDLALVLAAVRKKGIAALPRIHGDYSFALWNARERSLLAARDAFGQRGLFARLEAGALALSSRASLLARGEEYDPEFIATYLVAGTDPAERSPFAGVFTVPSGAVLTWRAGDVRVVSHWSPSEAAEQPVRDEREVVERFRDLFARAVVLRADTPHCWSQLSGGLDSSSVVSMAAHLARAGVMRHPLLGTITMIDTLGDGDERRFVRAVVDGAGVRNEQVRDDWLWRDDGQEPPRTEAPTANYPFFARDRLCCEIVRGGGGRVLLTGQGGDQYLSALPYYIADDLWRLRLGDACRGALEWAVTTRRSFWSTIARFGVAPLLPPWARVATAAASFGIPAWVRPALARATRMRERLPMRTMLSGRRGDLYRSSVAYETAHYGRYTDVALFQEMFELRHPFLYRPLVELGLSLPARLRTRPREQKWILRQAMRDILPDEVRVRTGKGAIDSRIVWSLERERARLREMLREPILADLGCVEPGALRDELERASQGRVDRVVPLMCALSLETWLQVRAGRWTVRAGASSDALRSAS